METKNLHVNVKLNICLKYVDKNTYNIISTQIIFTPLANI